MKSLNFTFDISQLSTSSYTLISSFSIRFWLYLIPNTLSILCSIFVLYYLLFDRILRQALHNHVIIIVLFAGLIYELTSVPFMLCYYHFGSTWKITTSFANFWTFIDSLCYAIQLIGFAWASIERHILIFHISWVATKKKRFLIHYLPLIAILIYCFIYYFVFDLFPFCGDFSFLSPANGVPVPCILTQPVIGKWEALCNQVIPTFIIIIISPALLLRVLKQKARLNRSIDWRKQRKMTIQLLSISILYLLLNSPRSITQLYNQTSLSTTVSINAYVNFVFFSVYTVFFFPFVCCETIPELGKKLKKLLFCARQQRIIGPEIVSMHRMEKKRMNQIGTDVH